MQTQSKEFSWDIRVYYEDTDSGNVVYYANYLKYMERARTELLRELGFEQDQLQQKEGIIFVVKSASINYKKPAKFNDLLTVKTTISQLGKASIEFKQIILRQQTLQQAEYLLSNAKIKIACLATKNFSVQALPKFITEKIKQEYYCGS